MYSRKKTHLGLIWLFYGNWQMVHLPNMDKRHRAVLTLVTASVGTDVAWYWNYSTSTSTVPLVKAKVPVEKTADMGHIWVKQLL